MSRKLNYKSISPFHDRLYELLGSDIPGWTRRIGVSKGTITNRWLKGSYPGADKIKKICDETGKSADWLLTGKEKKKNCPICNSDKNIKDLCEKVKILIESKTHWGDSLQANINSFKVGYDHDGELNAVRKDITDLRRQVDGLTASPTSAEDSGAS